MGNSASMQLQQQDVDADAPLPDDLLELSDRQLKLLWEDRPLTLHEIQETARSFKKTTAASSPRTSPRNKSSASTASDDSHPEETETVHYLSGLYYSRDPKAKDDSPETALAVRLSQLLSELALLRFRMVPARLKEDKFWMATLALLKERLVEYNAARLYFQEEASESRNHYNENGGAGKHAHMNGTTATTTRKTIHDTNCNGHPTNDLEHQVKAQKAHIAKLTKKVKELEDKLTAAASSKVTPTKKKTSSFPSKSPTASQASSSHRGSWRMDPDSKEFLNYPPEIKENLRAEKQRRLQQVQKEMKFILDSDEIHDTHGKWDCCGARNYHASCTM